ncbi:hypothetical protein E1B28_013491 [Marasmius oreades]|uniref:non-specific serine/threonine protein kinase n=1 Tax=Marasmius oreades TaxID=181124 RepID=A0A9P7RQA4_9AGAR|nr:uncharacterized protein E1B28_013491 [Marasmius oreades]KAG7087532.1 hypothetical protein E1B28_013491 [Marasmius oreades]
MLYVPIEHVESCERYCPGVYHPLNIGDILNSRYHIVNKLGFGTYSTVWLARDQSTSKYVAVKIPVANETCQGAERHILRLLSARESPFETSRHRDIFPFLLDEFQVVGPNGTHRCLVTPPARMSVADARDESGDKPFQLPVARAIAAQLIQAVAFLHSKGIVHSDIHNGNVLFHLPNSIDHLTLEQLYEKISFPADIWMLACTIFSILGQAVLFPVLFSNPDWAIKVHVDTLGRLPSEWWEKWEKRAEWFDEDGEPKDGQPRQPLKERYESSIQGPRRKYGMEEFSDEEGAVLISLLKSMFTFNPRDRPTAKEVLESEWMNRWARHQKIVTKL